MPKPVKLTVDGIAKAQCPLDKTQQLFPIEGYRGTYLRVRRGSPAKPVQAQYRDKQGTQRWFQVCADATGTSPKDIADAIEIVRGRLAKGEDPAGERKVETKRARARLEPALAAYETDLERRHVVKRGEVMSLLRRELARPLGNVDLATLTRNDLVQRIAAVEASGRPGAAQELRKVAAVFLSWCADSGRITASPLAGWRQQRRTKAQRLDRPGRALDDWEIPLLWQAADDDHAVVRFGLYLKLLLLLGQRRTETALIRWRDLDFKERVWVVPAVITKSGREHRVPLPTAVCEEMQWRARHAGSALVFPGRGGKPMTGWSKRLPAVYERTAKAGMAPWTPHDLRRTARTGLGRLGVDPLVSEMLLNHAISDDLAARYDRGDYWELRVEAAERWAEHVMGLVKAGGKAVRVA